MFVTKGNETGKETVSTTGARRDSQDGKPRYDLIGLHMLRRLAELLERGARKYSERNWEKGQEASRTLASLWRHLIAYQEGDRVEDHLAAIVFNAMSIMHVEGEVQAGRLSAALLDLPFYAQLDEFKQDPNQPTQIEKIVLNAMQEIQDGDNFVMWTPSHLLQQETLPSLNENEFAQVMRSLTEKGLVCPAVVMERVHPDYALKSALDEIDEEDSSADWDYDSGYDQEGSDDDYSDDTSSWGDTGGWDDVD